MAIGRDEIQAGEFRLSTLWKASLWMLQADRHRCMYMQIVEVNGNSLHLTNGVAPRPSVVSALNCLKIR